MKNWPKACFGQKFWDAQVQNVLDKKISKSFFYDKSQLQWFFGWKSKRITRKTGRWRKKYFFVKLWNQNFSCIERFYRSQVDLIGNGSTNSVHLWLVNLDWLKQPVISQFEPELTKTARDWPIWTRTDQNGPWLANLEPNWPKRPVIS